MISHHGSRFIVYSIVSPVKIVLFLGSMVSAHYTDIYTTYSTMPGLLHHGHGRGAERGGPDQPVLHQLPRAQLQGGGGHRAGDQQRHAGGGHRVLSHQYCHHKELICAVRARAGDTAGLHPRGPRAPRGLRAAGPGLLQHGRLLGRQVRSQGDQLSSVLIRICTAPPQNIVNREMLLPPLMCRCVSRAWASPCP